MADDDIDETEDPALKDFNRPAFQVQHTLGKTVKYGVIGAAAGGTALAGVVALGTLLGGPLAWAAAGVTAAAGWLPAVGSTLFTTGLTWGGVAGAAIGAATGITSADEAADEEAERRIDQAERREVKRERLQALRSRHDEQALAMGQQAQMLGMAPTVPFGKGAAGQER